MPIPLRFIANLCFLGAVSLGTCAAGPPNIVLIISDDQAWTDFGFMGHGAIQTPHLDRLASQGALFSSGYVPTSICRPSLASIITGLYPHEHRICVNDPVPGSSRDVMQDLIRKVPTIPRLLSQANYNSLQTGKWWEGHYSGAGFTDGMTPDMTTGGFHGGPGVEIGRETMKPIYDFIDQVGEENPYFIWYAPKMPHTPHDPPERLLNKYLVEGRDIAVARYYAMCEWFDETVGELVDYIDRKGQREKTLILFVVDNGWVQQLDGQQTAFSFVRTTSRRTRGNFAPKSKNTPYDGGLRTPIIVQWPGHVKPGRYSDLVSSIDLAPTILAAAGLKPPAVMKGLNLLEVASGKQSRLERDTLFGAVFYQAARESLEPAHNLAHRWVRFNDWKLIDSYTRSLELYNVVQDPYEEQNLVTQHPELVKKMLERLDGWWTGAPEPKEKVEK